MGHQIGPSEFARTVSASLLIGISLANGNFWLKLAGRLALSFVELRFVLLMVETMARAVPR